MKKYLLIFGVLFLVLTIAKAHKIPEGCNENYRHDMTIDAGENDIKAELADSETEQQKGLGGRECMGESTGMLFAFDRPGYYNFWMKDMNFPIDIVWIDSNKKVIEVTDNIQPSSYPDTFVSNGTPQYVLEVSAGHAAELGLSPGLKLSF